MTSSSTAKRVVLITGTSRGLGRHLAEHFVGKGDLVVGCSRGAASLDHENYRHLQTNVGDEVGVKRVFSEITKAYGRLDVLINNAGIASMNHLLLTPAKVARDVLETNFTGTFLFTREAAKLMKKTKSGRIVNVVSVATPLKLEGEAVYAASKAAVISFTQISARELAPFGITVNAVGPTPIQTDLIRSVPEEKIAELIKRQAIQRPGEPRDVSNVVDFFLQPESDFITGQIVFLGGV